MIPTEEEHAVRQQVINRITNVINQYLPTASVKLQKHSSEVEEGNVCCFFSRLGWYLRQL